MNNATLPPPVAPIEPVAPRPKFPKLGVKGWLGIGVAVFILLGMIGNALPNGDDTDEGLVPDAAIDEGALRSIAVDSTWDGMSASEQSEMCDGLDLLGDDLMLQGIDAGAEDMALSRAMLAKLHAEC